MPEDESHIVSVNIWCTKDGGEIRAVSQQQIWQIAQQKYPDIGDPAPQIEGHELFAVYLPGDDFEVGRGSVEEGNWFDAMSLTKEKQPREMPILVRDASLRSIYIETRTCFV